MTESKEYQEAVKLIAKKLEALWFNDSVRSFEVIARELLDLKYPCEKCDGKGTGKGGKVLAVRAKDQTITETLRTELDAYTERLLAHPKNMPKHMEIAIVSITGALVSVGFVKVVEE